MKKQIWLLIPVVLLVLAGCQQITDKPAPESPSQITLIQTGEIEPLNDRDPLPASKIDALVYENLRRNNRFDWKMVDDFTAWSALVRADSIVSVGYQPADYANLEETIHEINVRDAAWAQVKQALIDFILEGINQKQPDQPVEAADILVFGEKNLPYFNVKLADYETFARLRNLKQVRYAEPMGYGTQQFGPRSGAGCNNDAVNPPSSDFTLLQPFNTKASWHHAYHNIQQAWEVSQGDNITVGVIDTGVDYDQSKLGSGFTSGLSGGRFISRQSTFYTGWWWWRKKASPNDDCGHGTAMSGLIAAPYNGPTTVGVAYEANLISIKGTDDVVINGSNEKDGVSDAYYYLGGRSDVKIISLSLGDIFSSGQVTDAIQYAYNRDKLLLAAAGTSTSFTNWVGVIFPAWLNTTVAVTGVKVGSGLQRCSDCHSGNAVDFTIIMEKGGNTGPLTLSRQNNQVKYTGGSSAATATLAGIAALVWARNPSMSRHTVLNALKQSASVYPGRNSQYGWGTVDAFAAVSNVP